MLTPATFLKTRVGPARRFLVRAGACSAVNALLLIVQYRLLAAVVDDVLFHGRPLAALSPRLWIILALIVLRALVHFAGDAFAIAAAGLVKRTVRAELLAHLMALGPVRLKDRQSGGLATLLTDGVDALEPYYARFLPAMTTAALVPLVTLAAVVPMDWLSGLTLAATAPLIPLFMILIGKGAERLNQRQWARLARMSAHFLEAIQGLTTLKLFNASRREADAIARISDDYRLATMSVLRVAFLSALALEFFATLGVALVAVFVGFRLLAGAMGFERGFFILLLAPEFYLPLRSLGAHYHARMEAIGAATVLVEAIGQPPGDAVVAGDERPSHPNTPPDIVFEDVRLAYDDGRVALDGADFRLAAGTLTALVGPSGAGKSSAVSLLLGFVRPTGGRILVDGRPLDGLDVDAWRRGIAWVPQTPHLFRGSIADNIRLGSPDADDAAVERAAALVGALGFIRGLAGGLDHAVGEGGIGLSGGQKRLVALARAALRDAPLLLLDEPTASLDPDSERQVAEAVRILAAGRTVLVIAHRLDTVRTADQILVVEAGRVREQGRHDALMAACGLYARLVATGEAIADADGMS